jgi:pentatricopeptide repeat protein
MKSKGIERNVHTYTALMNVCIKCSKHALALETYKLMRQDKCTPNVVTCELPAAVLAFAQRCLPCAEGNALGNLPGRLNSSFPSLRLPAALRPLPQTTPSLTCTAKWGPGRRR